MSLKLLPVCICFRFSIENQEKTGARLRQARCLFPPTSAPRNHTNQQDLDNLQERPLQGRRNKRLAGRQKEGGGGHSKSWRGSEIIYIYIHVEREGGREREKKRQREREREREKKNSEIMARSRDNVRERERERVRE